jgi:hypothetical protein
MSVAAVELPPISDPVILSYLRLVNGTAPTESLQAERAQLRFRLDELIDVCRRHFEQCDGMRNELLLSEREEVAHRAKVLLRKIDEVQRANGFRSSNQAVLRDRLETAEQALQQFEPINRTVSTLREIAEDEVKQNQLRQQVNRCKQQRADNQRDLLGEMGLEKELDREYKGLQARQQAIDAELVELAKPFEERNKPKSSIVWNAGGTTFGLQR